MREFPVRPIVYWLDLVASAAIAWAACAIAVAGPPVALVPAIWIAALAILRAAYFIHELAHSRGRLPGFELAWNVLVGAWLQMPSFMADAHVDHHRLQTYGTDHDPEYEPIATWSWARCVSSVLVMPIVPPLLLARWIVIAPASWGIPRLRRFAWERMSTVQTNSSYRRRLGDPNEPRVIGFELLATLAAITGVVLIALGHLPLRTAWVWWAATSLALAVNQLRTLLAHAYESAGAPMTLEQQIGDTATGMRGSTAYVLGTRFHALHHLAPQLPYHALAAAHAQLLSRGAPACYRRTITTSLIAGIAGLSARSPGARRRARPPAIRA